MRTTHQTAAALENNTKLELKPQLHEEDKGPSLHHSITRGGHTRLFLYEALDLWPWPLALTVQTDWLEWTTLSTPSGRLSAHRLYTMTGRWSACNAAMYQEGALRYSTIPHPICSSQRQRLFLVSFSFFPPFKCPTFPACVLVCLFACSHVCVCQLTVCTVCVCVRVPVPLSVVEQITQRLGSQMTNQWYTD